MCTIAYIKNRPKRAKQDIITYKSVIVLSNYLILSTYRSFDYILGQLYKTNIVADIRPMNAISAYTDAKEYFMVRKRVKPSDPILSISNGFHSFSSLERIKKSEPLIGTIVECLIPAGSKIVTGIDKGLIVSDQIIITDVIAHI